VSYRIDIMLYEHENMGGERYPIQDEHEWKYQKNLHARNWGDRVSSVEVRSGWIALYEHPDFNGSVYKLGPGQRIVRVGDKGWDNVPSSYIACVHDFDPVDAATKFRGT